MFKLKQRLEAKIKTRLLSLGNELQLINDFLQKNVCSLANSILNYVVVFSCDNG